MKENIEKNYFNAKDTLFGLTSNEESIKNWIKDRQENKEINMNEEMDFHLSRLELDISKLSFIHIAGTKGKGSTCAFTESILRDKGLKTGMYISPHLVEPRERIKINGKSISENQFSSSFWEIYEKLKEKGNEGTNHPLVPPFFRFLTLMAFHVFLKENIDVCIMEVGLGGRCDATNVVKPVVCGITSIGYDHMNVLGNTLEEIGREKGGIIKRNVPIFSFKQQTPSIEEVFKNISDEKDSFLHFVDSSPLFPFPLGIQGHHQYSNAALSVYLSSYWFSLYSSLSNSKKRNLLSSSLDNNKNDNNIDDNANNINNENNNNKNNFVFQKFVVNRFIYGNNFILDHLQKEEIRKYDEKIVNEIKENIMGKLDNNSPIIRSLQNVKWRGRGQILDWEIKNEKKENRKVKLILDGAHTKESMVAFTEWISTLEKIGEQTNILIFNCNQSKNVESLLEQIISIDPVLKFKLIIFTTNDQFENENNPHNSLPTSLSLPQSNWQDKMKDIWISHNKEHSHQKILVSPSLKDSFLLAHSFLSSSPSHTVPNVFFTGSLYLVGAVLKYIKFDVDDL